MISLVIVIAGILCGHAMAQASTTSAQQPPAQQQTPAPAQQPAGTENFGGSQVLHILVGHSVVIRTDARLRRVLVGNPNVVTTTTTAPNELVITAIAAGSSSVVIWQIDNQSRLLEVFGDLDVSLLREAVARGFPGEQIDVEAEESRVVVTGTASSPAIADQIVKMAGPFSKDIVNSLRIALPGRQKQILLKVRFAQVDRGKLNEFGLNIISTGGANTVGTTTTGQFAPPTTGNSQLTGVIPGANAGFTS